MVLYHAISSYQLLEVMLHKITEKKQVKGILVLPDFIIEKYPQYRRLVELNIFDEVYLFPYLMIAHTEEKNIVETIVGYYEEIIPYNIAEFDEVFIAGAHFYFSLYLIYKKVEFHMFEDAAGMLSRDKEIYENLKINFPVHADIAKKHGLFRGNNRYIKKVFCLKRAQTIRMNEKKYQNFCVEDILYNLSFLRRKKVIRFFIKSRIDTKADTILLTQQFANLGIMSEEEEKAIYGQLKEKILHKNNLIIKKHPDDTLDYKLIFPGVQVIEGVFPSELLPYIFKKKPIKIVTFNSTGAINLEHNFIVERIKL